jgi:uncharacterized protein YecE (DUF72 family)
MKPSPKRLVARSVGYYSKYDEDQFFGWLEKIPCVAGCRGEKVDLFIDLHDGEVDDKSLRELLALFNRYNVDMSQLAIFESSSNRQWFREPRAYWYTKVFECK